MIISEIFYSLQGEGLLAGVPSVFIRVAGCPLRCKWCDTKYAWDGSTGNDYTIDEIVKKIQPWTSKFVVITGGEPMTNPDLPQLAKSLKANGRHITIETAGIVDIQHLPCDLMSISPKLTNSIPDDPQLASIHEASRFDIEVLARLIDNYEYQLKFVVDRQADLAEIDQTIEKLGNIDSGKVILMPQAKTRAELLAKSAMVAQMCKQTGFVFSQRLQILLWDNQRAT